MPVRLQFRRGTEAQWTSADPTLAQGELGVAIDTGQFKVGDGFTAWSSLIYGGLIGPTGVQGSEGIQGSVGEQGVAGVTGPQGIQGPQGVQGAEGPIGSTGMQSTVTGPTGWTGNTGPTGAASMVTGPTGQQGTNGTIGVDGVTGPTGPAGSGGGGGSSSGKLVVTEVTGTSATLASTNYNGFFYLTNSGFNALTLPSTTAIADGGSFWTLRNATNSSLSMTLTNTLSLTSPLVIPPANSQTLTVSGTTSNTILLM